MKYRDLYYLVGQCISLKTHPEHRQIIIKTIETDNFDWENFIRLCSNHYILPVIYLNFKANNLIDIIPVEITEHLQTIYELNYNRNQLILKQMEELVDVLNKQGIKPVFLKGTANLLDGLYIDSGERMIGDIDFLVSELDYLKTADIVLSMGYEIAHKTYVDVTILKHYPLLWRTDVPANVEIHRRAVEDEYNNMISPELIFSNMYSVKMLPGCFIPAINLRVIHNFIHQHLIDRGHAYGQTSFRSLYDLLLFSQKTELEPIANECKKKQKAISYFTFAQQSLGISGSFYDKETLYSRFFCLKANFFLKNKIIYKINHNFSYVLHRVFKNYVLQGIEFFLDKKVRQSVIRRLVSKDFYAAHIQSYKNFFNGR